MSRAKKGDAQVEAFKPTPEQYESAEFPPYAQIVLRLPTAPARTTTCEHYLDSQLAWDVRDALARVQVPEGGQSIVEELENEIDNVMDDLMVDGEPEHTPTDMQAYGELRGQAQGLARAISLMRSMSYDAVRAEAVDRWEARQDG